ncbi:hypothetical protein Cgig2_020387 [Carnegiea gigantea]|uniref:DUF4283 domain-containing protein n=1 Tax=Carnegiea gigantea TaxID=171969 RepID=A0A9Q1JKB3_9CARY|nr:hypothetical protein Cgig2_020387 [Carnegiea gigantea]
MARGGRRARSRLVAQGSPVAPQEVNNSSSYASLFDPDEGTDLKFISVEIINRRKLGPNPPFEVIQGFFKRMWVAFEMDKIIQVRKGVFLVHFVNVQDKIAVEKRGIYYFDAKLFLVKGWNPKMDLHNENLKSLPIWVQLSKLDIRFWGSGSISKLGSSLGIPLKTDKYTKERTMLKYTRLVIDIPLDGPFPDYIDFFHEEEVLIR